MIMDDIEVDNLISLVEERPILWDRTSKDYKERTKRQAAWEEVCENLLPGYQELSNQEKTKQENMVVKKWTGIKDNYAKYVKKLKEIKKTGAKKIKEYHLYKQLLFLNKNDQNESRERIIEDNDDDDDDKKNVTKQIHKRRLGSPSRSQPPQKRRIVNAFEEEIMLKLQEPENRHISFFKAILPSLNKLSDQQTLIYQSRVLQILTDLYEPSQQNYYTQGSYRSFDE